MPDDTLRFAWNDLDLAGTLRLPDHGEQHPVVVMLQGSGPTDRTSEGYFTPIQDAFLARGIGTFAFDKPGCGDSTGDWRDYALEARADQGVAALNAVQAHPMVGVLRFVREGYEPLMALERICGPFMAVYGGRDVLVPAWRSAQESGDALERAGNADATVVVFPGGDHRIQDVATGGFVDGYLDLLADWVVH